MIDISPVGTGSSSRSVKVRLTLERAGTVKTGQVTTPAEAAPPSEALTPVVLGGSSSVRCTPVAASSPRLVTLRV